MASQRATRNAFTVILCVMVLAFSINSWGLRNQQDAQDRLIADVRAAQVNININNAKISATIKAGCEDKNTASEGTNSVLSTLQKAVNGTESIGAQERAVRTVMYQKAKVPIIRCDK